MKDLELNVIDVSGLKKHYHGHRQRVRNKALTSKDLSHLQDYEILEIVLFYCNKRKDVKEIAKNLLQTYGTIANLMRQDPYKLQNTKGLGDSFVLFVKTITEIYSRSHLQAIENKNIFANFEDLILYLNTKMSNLTTEQFRVLYLDSKGKLIKDELESEGTVNQTTVYPREIAKKVLDHKAVSIVLVHNHPSGDPTPSKSDILLTQSIMTAVGVLDVIVQDHIIIAHNSHYSFRQSGLISV